jgi:hypothetical protein
MAARLRFEYIGFHYAWPQSDNNPRDLGQTSIGLNAGVHAAARLSGPALLAGAVRSLAPTLNTHGIATAEELDRGTLEQRIAKAARDADAVILLPAVVGAWGCSPAAYH